MLNRKFRTMNSCFYFQLVIVILLVTFPTKLQSFKLRDVGIEYGESEDEILLQTTMLPNILIQGGTVVNADRKEIADIYIKNGLIVDVKPNIEVGDDVYTVVNATGKYVMPGGIDPHTHLDHMDVMGAQTIDDFFSGQAAALAGGTTMHIDFVMPSSNGSYIAGFNEYMIKAQNSCMDYAFHAQILSWNDTVSNELDVLVNEKGMNSFKFFLSMYRIHDDQLIEAFKKCKSLGAVAMVHAENEDAAIEGTNRMLALKITGPEGHALSRPAVVEGEAVGRAIRLAGFVNTPLYVVHVMSIDAMEEVAKARKLGQRVIGQPIIVGLVLNESWYWNTNFTIAAKYVMSPPIMPIGHAEALQAALSRGALQLVGTDHCSFNSTQKAAGINDFRNIPGGVNGIEERMPLVWNSMVESGKISVTDYVRITSTESAKIFNIYPKKGAILVGSDADIIILNPNATFEISASTHHSKSDTNVFEGITGKGKIEVTIAGGRIVWQNDELNVVPGSGKHIMTPPFGYLFDGLDKSDAAYLSSLNAPVLRQKSAT